MGREETLQRVRSETESGDLGKARDRLQGLLLTYPEDMEIRRMLGTVFWRLQYPEKAGQYWYLLGSESEDMDIAKRAFERRYHSSPSLMLYELRYRGGLDALVDTYAERELKRLARDAYISQAELAEMVAPKRYERPRPNLREGATVAAGGGVAIMLLLLLVIGIVNGAITIFRWLF